MTTAQVATLLGCNKSTASKWAKSHSLAKPGHDYVWTPADVENFRCRPRPGKPSKKAKMESKP
jgi:hypothetical protein